MAADADDGGGVEGSGPAEEDPQDESALSALRNVVLTGIAVIIPIIATLYILWFVYNVIRGTLAWLVRVLTEAGVLGQFERRELFVILIETGLYSAIGDFVPELIALALLVALILAVGAFARHRYGEVLIDVFDHLIASIPGIGAIYSSFRQVGDMVLDETAEDFEGVLLIEALGRNTYLLAFETNRAPPEVETAAGYESMTAVFIPMAPNPVTGGFLTYVPEERIVDVDLTIDQAVTAILTSGLATEEDEDSFPLEAGFADGETLDDVVDPRVDHDSHLLEDLGPEEPPSEDVGPREPASEDDPNDGDDAE